MRVDVVEGVAREIAITTPEGVTVNNVTGATVADWSQAQGTLIVTFVEPLTNGALRSWSPPKHEHRAMDRSQFRFCACRRPSVRSAAWQSMSSAPARSPIVNRVASNQRTRAISATSSPAASPRRWSPLASRRSLETRRERLSVTVSRYTPQPVLVANVEEARYEVVAAEDGKLLVRARYAVRNNQRAFVALRLPAQSTLWSATLARTAHTSRPRD